MLKAVLRPIIVNFLYIVTWMQICFNATNTTSSYLSLSCLYIRLYLSVLLYNKSETTHFYLHIDILILDNQLLTCTYVYVHQRQPIFYLHLKQLTLYPSVQYKHLFLSQTLQSLHWSLKGKY